MTKVKGTKNDGRKKPKRGHGDGSFYYDEKRKRWIGKIMLGYKPDGKLNRYTRYGKTRSEAASKIDALKRHYQDGTLMAPTKITVSEYLVGDVEMFKKGEAVGGWLEIHKRFGGRKGKGLRPNTFRSYRAMIKNHILPEIGRIQLQKLTASHLEQLYASILQKKTRGGKTISMRQAELAHQVLNVAFGAAEKKDLIRRNPCHLVPEKPRTNYRAEDRPRLDRSLVPEVLAVVKDTTFYLPILLAVSTALRRGEILGLRWKNVTLHPPPGSKAAGYIHVREQITHDENDKLALDPVLKSERAYRDVPIPADVVAALEVEQGTRNAGPEDFVCATSTGNYIDPADLDHAWADVREELNLQPNLTLHDLRGSWTTWLAAKKVDLKAASQAAGHSDERTTLRLYQSVTEGMRDEVAQAMEGITRATDDQK